MFTSQAPIPNGRWQSRDGQRGAAKVIVATVIRIFELVPTQPLKREEGSKIKERLQNVLLIRVEIKVYNL